VIMEPGGALSPSARPASRCARRHVGPHMVLFVSLAVSHLGCRGINRNQETLDPNLALALLRKDAGSSERPGLGSSARPHRHQCHPGSRRDR
jgi:hypothetical protein